MSALWYEYLEESGGEVIASKYFNHVCRSLDRSEEINDEFKVRFADVMYARNHNDKFWWPIKIVESLSEGWLRFEYVGLNEISEMVWWNTRSNENTIRTINWCVNHNVEWASPVVGNEINISEIVSHAPKIQDTHFQKHSMCAYERIKVGGYLECWLENSVGLVWPVRVLSNIGGRVRLVWFGCESAGKHGASATFVLFYLDQRLRGLGWARLHGWRYSAPENAGIVIIISNAETFVRGSPAALPRELCNEYEPEDHLMEDGWQIEAVDPYKPCTIRPAFVKKVLDRKYFLVQLDTEDGLDVINFPGYSGLASLMPANLSGVSGFQVHGLTDNQWHSHLFQTHPDRYAPHAAYFLSVESEFDSVFLPGCKLEAVNPWRRDQIHAATVTRCMEGNRLIWVRLDSEPDLPDFLVDPVTSVDLFPVGWCEMVNHGLVLPVLDPISHCMPSIDLVDVTIYLHPQCFLGPFLSRSSASQILPRFIGPGHCIPVFKELFRLLLKVSHKPHKLKRLLQLDNVDDHRDLMASIAIPSPKSEHSHRNRRPDWLVEVAVRKRAIPEFCRQTALSLGACPWFITTQGHYHCSLDCEARLSAKAGEKMSLQRRKRLFLRPLTAIGISYRTLKSRIAGNNSNSSSNSDGDSSETEDTHRTMVGNGSSRIQTRGVRVPIVCEEPRRRGRRRPMIDVVVTGGGADQPLSPAPPTKRGIARCLDPARGRTATDTMPAPVSLDHDHCQYAIDPSFLAGDIGRVTLTSNPVHWTADQVADYLSHTDCRQLASWLANERVDGTAFLLLTLPVLSTLCGLQLEPAIRLCKHVVSLKRAFVEQFVDHKLLLPPDL